MTATQQTFPFTPASRHVQAPRARRSDPDTSHAAARAAQTLGSRHAHDIVEVMARAAAPLAAEQIADRVGLTSVQVNRRLRELVDLEVIEPTEHRHRNRSGRHAVQFRIKGGR